MTMLTLLDPDRIFSIAGAIAALAWLALALSPNSTRWASRVRWWAGRAVPLLFAVVYVLLFAVHGMGDGGYGSLAEVRRLFDVPGLLAAGWLHYLAFDLFVGAWIAERAGALGIPHLLVLPLLLLTFMFGPAGLLAFALLRAAWRRRGAAAGLRARGPTIPPPPPSDRRPPMHAPTLAPTLRAATSPCLLLRHLVAEAMARERRLTTFAFVLVALAVPMALAGGLDERVVRGANVWIKPVKFALSIGLLALTTAWFIGHLQPAKRRGPAVDRIVWLLIGTGSFELAYITLQAALGQGSHFNVGDAFHGTMYTLMGIGAIGLTATQPMLAWQLHRHADPARPRAYRLAVKLGLVLTFVFGAGVGMLLSGLQPPDGGAAVPLLGWQLGGGDLRPAHFVGIHAGQCLPLVGLLVAARADAQARARVGFATAVYTLVFVALVAWGLQGRV